MSKTSVSVAAIAILVSVSVGAYVVLSVRTAADLRAAVDRWQTPEVGGVVLGIERPWRGQTIIVSGLADRTTRRAVEATDRFAIGSVSKTFVAAAVMQLAAEGSLELEKTLGDYALGPDWAGSVTIHQLLNNRSGIADFQNEAFYADAATDLTRTYAPLELITRFAGGQLQFVPGSRFDYSSSNFVLLGLLIEKRTGLSLPDLLRHRFVEPLGLAHTDFDPLAVGPVVGYSRAHASRFGQSIVDTSQVPRQAIASAAWAAGMMVSNAHDLLVWVRALYGGRVLQPESLRQMRAFDPAFGDYGLGTYRKSAPAGDLVGHGGIHFGYLAEAWYLPSADAGIVALANDDAADLFALVREASTVLGERSVMADVDAQVERLRAAGPAVRRQAALDLGKTIGPRGPEVVAVLAATLQSDPAPEVRAACALALGLVGRSDPASARAALQQAATDPDADVREATARAIAGLNRQ